MFNFGKKKNQIVKSFKDGFHSMMETMGARRRDITSRMNGYFAREVRLDYNQLNAIYQTVPVVRRAVELITTHILKNGVSFSIPNEEEATRKVVELAEKCQVNKLFEEAVLSTLINGCAGVLLIDRTQKPTNKLNLAYLKGRKPQFSIIDGRFIAVSPELDPLSPRYYQPKQFFISGMSADPSFFNAFVGLPVSQVIKPQYKYMGMSLIENSYQPILNDELISKAIPNIVYRSSIVNYKIAGMKDSIKMGEEETILKYVSTAEDAKSILNATITDADDTVEVLNRQLTGLNELDQRSAYRLSASLGIPANVLWGKSPDGMNATGNSDMENFYNFIESWQNRFYENLKWFYKIFVACVTGRDDLDFKLSFNKANMITPEQKVSNDATVLANVSQMQQMGLPDSTINRYLVEHEILTEDEAVEFDELKEEMENQIPQGLEFGGEEDFLEEKKQINENN